MTTSQSAGRPSSGTRCYDWRVHTCEGGCVREGFRVHRLTIQHHHWQVEWVASGIHNEWDTQDTGRQAASLAYTVPMHITKGLCFTSMISKNRYVSLV
jgi:hypothetical protein